MRDPGAAGHVSNLSFNGNHLALAFGTQAPHIYDLTSLIDPPQSPLTGMLQIANPGRGITLEKQPDGWLLHFGAELPLAGNPGGPVSLETSIDLATWETAARYLDGTGWQPVLDGIRTDDGTSIRIHRTDATRYFRLRHSPGEE